MTKEIKPIKNLMQKRLWGKRITLTLFGALISLFVLWKTENPNITLSSAIMVFAAQTLPLWALLPGLIRNHYRSYSWLCFALLFYFIFAVERSFVSTANIYDYLFLMLTVLLFIATMMTGRWQQRVHIQNPNHPN
ncbi:DUF2069 domain-containing protein [Teredinibacter sp. KSP-S5-2]|uniref:DUF2069 domain-containing protein n=1 Tax=Teredinibacter sp. KSP-S5-2 TaxID=3034506 RepID=UPI0029341001|nr:DUF2069 domain-containing protein [Teredinibacter sp. KSP-S5-2]WNO09664.1 DUF2069 domain-containing protein [Teredinibacter sp. KSP-S5-2]